MLKKVFTVFLVCCFFSNIVLLNAMAVNYPSNIISNNNINNIPNEVSNYNHIAGYGEGEGLINSVNILFNKISELDSSSFPDIKYLSDNNPAAFAGNLEELHFIINYYLQDLTTGDYKELTPGCFSHFMFAWLGVFIVTPFIMYYAIYSLIENKESCPMMYSLFALSSLSAGLTSWVNYRICTEQNADNPDQQIINELQQDKNFLINMSSISLVLGGFFAVQCGESFFNFDGFNFDGFDFPRRNPRNK